jgi:hypothetical protein
MDELRLVSCGSTNLRIAGFSVADGDRQQEEVKGSGLQVIVRLCGQT